MQPEVIEISDDDDSSSASDSEDPVIILDEPSTDSSEVSNWNNNSCFSDDSSMLTSVDMTDLPTPPHSDPQAIPIEPPSSPIRGPDSTNDESDDDERASQSSANGNSSQSKRPSTDDNPRPAKRRGIGSRPSPWHGKDTKGSTPVDEAPANPADSEPVFWNVYRHQETGALICGECDKHKPMVVLPNQWRNHLTRHHPDMDQNTKRKLGEMLRTYNVKELPTNIDTQLPMIPVEARRYCFHCGGVFENLRDHTPHDECFTGFNESVWCQFYHQNKGVIIGPTPRQPTEAQLRRMAREFLPPAKVYTRAELEDSRRRQMAESITFYRPHPWEICLWWDD